MRSTFSDINVAESNEAQLLLDHPIGVDKVISIQ